MKKSYMMPLLFAVGSFASYGQVAKQLKSPTPVAYSQFGRSVVNVNQHTLVGVPTEGQGAIYLFHDGNYVSKYTFDKLGDDNSALGTSVVLNSNWFGAGAPYRNFVGSEDGFAILGRRGQTGGLNYYIIPSDLQGFDRFGESMAISERWLAVGAPGQNESKGTVYLYKEWQSNGNRGWDPKGKITLPNLPSGAGFGSSVAIFEQNGSSDRLIVGAPHHSGGGRIFVFKRSGDNWNLEFQYTPSNVSQLLGFGSSVDITQNVLIVGAPFTGNNGFATILKFENNAWVVKHQYHGFTYGSRFGNSVALHYNRAAVGAPEQGTTGELHLYDDQGGYQHKGTLYNGQTGSELLGFSVDIEADWIVSGAVFANVNGVPAGAAYRLEFYKALQSASWRKATSLDAEVMSEALYPNPATEGKVRHNIAGVQHVQAISTVGGATDLGFDANSIDVSTLAPGVYSLKITTGEGTKIQKLAVE